MNLQLFKAGTLPELVQQTGEYFDDLAEKGFPINNIIGMQQWTIQEVLNVALQGQQQVKITFYLLVIYK